MFAIIINIIIIKLVWNHLYQVLNVDTGTWPAKEMILWLKERTLSRPLLMSLVFSSERWLK